MTVQRMDHVGIVVEDLAAAVGFFAELGLESAGEWTAEDPAVGRIIGLEGVRADVAMMEAPDGRGRIELVRFHSPASEKSSDDVPANAPGIRHLTFEVDDLDATLGRLRGHGGELVGEVESFGGSYRLCYLRGPAGIILELAERIG
jgi:catechol 2,3-dioxygenase-like lactoylglutathione lyase family enzyme